MIRCSRCGKLYDYDKYNGICPVCARYNRKDSDNQAEQELHRKYDSNPWAHMADNSHREVHRVNQDSYRHRKDEYAPGHGTYAGQFVRQEAKKKSPAGKNGSRGKSPAGKKNPSAWVSLVVIVIFILLFAAGIIQALFDELDFSEIRDAVGYMEQQYDGDDAAFELVLQEGEMSNVNAENTDQIFF